MLKLYKRSLFEELRFPVGKCRRQLPHVQLFIKAHRVVYIRCIYWYRVGRADTGLDREKRVVDEMEVSRKLALLGMLGYTDLASLYLF